MIQVDIDRYQQTQVKNFYDLTWKPMGVDVFYLCPSDYSKNEEKPSDLGKILRYSKKFLTGFPHVRVNFYIVEGKIIFGELTFSTAAGFRPWNPKEFDVELGKKFEFSLNE